MTLDVYMLLMLIVMGEIVSEWLLTRNSSKSVQHHIRSHILILLLIAVCLTYFILTNDLGIFIIPIMGAIWHLNKETRSMSRTNQTEFLEGF